MKMQALGPARRDIIPARLFRRIHRAGVRFHPAAERTQVCGWRPMRSVVLRLNSILVTPKSLPTVTTDLRSTARVRLFDGRTLRRAFISS